MIRYLGTVTGGERPVPFVRLDALTDLYRLQPCTRVGSEGFKRGVHMVTDFGVFPIKAADAAGLLDLMRRDGLSVPPRVARSLAAGGAR